MAKKEEEQEAPQELPMPESPVDPPQHEEPQSDGEGPSTFDLQFPNASEDE